MYACRLLVYSFIKPINVFRFGSMLEFDSPETYQSFTIVFVDYIGIES